MAGIVLISIWKEHDYGAIWEAALNNYEENIGIDKQSLTKARSVDDVLREVKARESRFSEHRHDGRKLDRLRSAVSESLVPIERLGHVTATIAGNVYPPAHSILGAAQFFISNATSMSDDYDRVVKCFEDVKQYLGRLKILEENVELTAAIKKAIIDVFTSLLALFGIFAKYTKIRRTKKFIKNLIFGEDTELKHAYNHLQKVVEQEQRIIAYTTQGDVRQIKQDITALQLNDRRRAAVIERTKYDTSIIVKDVDYLKVQTDTRTILQWLSSLDFLEKHRNISEKHQEGTGEWLLQDPNFQLFYQSKDIHTIWCSGIPGAGKTVLTSLAINFVEEWYQEPEIAIAYFYCDYKDSRTFSETQFMSSIIKQLVGKHVRILSDVRIFHDKHTRKSKPPNRDEWMALLQSITSCFHKTFIFVDALDECDDNRRRKFLSVIKTLSTSIRLFITSRDYLELHETFPEIKRIKIEARDADVKTFIEAGFEDNENFHELIIRDSTLKEDVANCICEKAAGMFLLADLLFTYLCEQQNCQAARNCLNSLPSTVDDFYEGAISRIKDKFETKKILAERALSYIYCSKRPLTVKELLEALGVEYKSTGQPKFTPPEANVLRNATAGLISFATNGVTSLVHYSLQEYFDRNPKALISDPELDLANTCLTYIMFNDLQGPSSSNLHGLLHRLPFLDYASNNFGAHMMAYQQHENIFQRFLIFLTCRRKLIKVYEICLHREFGLADKADTPTNLKLYIKSCSRNLNVLHFVVRLGLHYVFEKIYNSGLYTEDYHKVNGTSLHVAAKYGHHDTIRFLVSKNVSLDALNEQGETALMLAVKHRDKSIMSTLITAGADPNLFSAGSHSPLCLAVQSGSTEIMSMLLKHCNIAELDSHIKKNLFFDAGRLGNQKIMQMLLNTKGSLDKTRSDEDVDFGLEALKGAIDSKNKAMFFMIIQDLPALTKYNRNLNFLLYSKFCDKPMLQSLLRLGANVSSDLTSYGQLIIYWALHGDEHIMRLLLDLKADLNAADHNGFTPLHSAVVTNNREKVSLLLEKGASPNNKDLYGFTPLHFAVVGGNAKIIQLLLDNGASWETEDYEGWTPLHFAFLKKESRIIQERLYLTNTIVEKVEDELRYPLVQVHFAEKEINTFLRLYNLNTSLRDKFCDGDTDPVLLSLQLDFMDSPRKSEIIIWEEKHLWHLVVGHTVHQLIVEDYVTKKGLHGWSLIHAASEMENKAFLEFLLDLDTDINARFIDLTPLHTALSNMKFANALLLIQHGADVNILTCSNQNALHIASWHNNYRLMKLLVSHGADVNMADYWGKTALMYAIQPGETEDRLDDKPQGSSGDGSDDIPNDIPDEESDDGSSEESSDESLDNESSDESDIGPATKSKSDSELVVISEPDLSSALVGSISISIRDEHNSRTKRVYYDSKLEIADDLAQSAQAFNFSADSPGILEEALEGLFGKIQRKLEENLENNSNRKLNETTPEKSETSFKDKPEIHVEANLACTSDNDLKTKIEGGSDKGLFEIPGYMSEDRSDNEADNKSEKKSDSRVKIIAEGTKHEERPRRKLLLEGPATIRKSSHSAPVKFLLQNGASINTLSRDGCNALHEAAFFGNTELMRLLVEAGSDIEVYAEASFRPVDVAVAMGHEAAVQLLLEKGASLKADSHHVSIIKDDFDDQNSYDRLLPMDTRLFYRHRASIPRRVCNTLLEKARRNKNWRGKNTDEWTVGQLAELSGNHAVQRIVVNYFEDLLRKKALDE